jgi:hypothetical protein
MVYSVGGAVEAQPHPIPGAGAPAPKLHDQSMIEGLAGDLVSLGVRRYVLQAFRADGCGDADLRASAAPSYLTPSWCDRIGARFESFVVRGVEWA